MKNLKNIIVIDFNTTSTDDVRKICDEFSLESEVMIEDNINFGLGKVYIDIVNKIVVAYTLKSNPYAIIYTDIFEMGLKALSPYVVKPVVSSVELSIDSILDKIADYGIDSLLKEEKEFLDQASKK